MGNSGRLTWVKLQQPQEQRYPFLTVYAVFSCVQAKVWLPMLGILNVHIDVNVCDCTWVLFGHRRRVCTESWLWGKNPLPHQGIEPASAVCWSDGLPTKYIPDTLTEMWISVMISIGLGGLLGLGRNCNCLIVWDAANVISVKLCMVVVFWA